MLLNKVNSPYCKHEYERLCQGDIFKEVTIIEDFIENADHEIEIKGTELRYAVLLTQDCDLEQDHDNRANTQKLTQDKYLRSLLLCAAYPAEIFRQGRHLEMYDLKMEIFNSDRWKPLKSNSLYRYHFLAEDLKLNVPDLVIDFKHHFTIPYQVARNSEFKSNYIATISDLFRANLSSRFCFYLGRIGLPIIEPALPIDN